MFNKPKAFALSRDSKKTKSSFMERFKFFRKEKHRDKCLERLRLWNERLHDLIHRAQARGQNAALVSKTPEPNINLKVASRVVKKRDQSPYRSAIEAFLDLDWSEERKVTLEGVEIRSGLYSSAIQSLEKGLEYVANFTINPRGVV